MLPSQLLYKLDENGNAVFVKLVLAGTVHDEPFVATITPTLVVLPP